MEAFHVDPFSQQTLGKGCRKLSKPNYFFVFGVLLVPLPFFMKVCASPFLTGPVMPNGVTEKKLEWTLIDSGID